MSESLIVRSDDDGVAHLTLNRPDKLNALTSAMFRELSDYVAQLAEDTTVGCVVLAGAGRSFCAGHDLETIGGDQHNVSPGFEAETISLFEGLPQPTIAKLHGHCFTGGLELALACDLLVSASSTQLGDTHGQWGLVPVWGMSVRLPERVGLSRAKELMFTSRRVDGAAAARIGLVDRCVADDALNGVVDELAAEIVANSWGTNRIDKALLAAGRNCPRDEALQFERRQPFGLPEDMTERITRPKSG